MAQGETERHRQLKALALAWARGQGLAIAASEVRVPKSGYRADVAACSRGAGRRTAVFERKQARADWLKDAHAEAEQRVALLEAIAVAATRPRGAAGAGDEKDLPEGAEEGRDGNAN